MTENINSTELVMNVTKVSVKNLGIKLPELIGGKWINYGGNKPEVEGEHLASLSEGEEIKLFVTNGTWVGFERTGVSPAKTISNNSSVPSDKKKTMREVLDEYVTFEELLKQLKEETNGSYVLSTKLVHFDAEKKQAVIHALLEGKFSPGLRKVEAHGDCDQTNGGMVKDHYIRMAETRAVARAIRMLLGIGKTAEEEMVK